MNKKVVRDRIAAADLSGAYAILQSNGVTLPDVEANISAYKKFQDAVIRRGTPYTSEEYDQQCSNFERTVKLLLAAVDAY